MASIGSPRGYVKEEPGEHSFAQNPSVRFAQKLNMTQQGFSQFGGMNGHGSMDPNDMVGGNYNSSPSGNGFNSNSFSTGNAMINDDDLLDSLGSPTDQMAPNHTQEFGGAMTDMPMGFTPGMYPPQPIDQGQMNGYSNTPDGDPIQSPFVHSYNQSQLRQMGHFGTSLQSPISYSGSPMASEIDARARLSQSVQQKAGTARSPLSSKTNPIVSMQEPGAFGAQPIRTSGVQSKSPSQQWVQTPTSLNSFSGSGFPSPIQAGMHNNQISDMLMQKAGTSMPAKLGTSGNPVSSQEMKRKRRRESHNLVERRRRDNINERIQDLSKLVPTHRLEDEKVRKMINNGTPLSPTLTGMSGPSQATSGLAGPGARRATSGGTGNITTGLPIEDKDKGPNKGDILNGSVSWTRDLMWILKVKLEQQEELMNFIAEQGLHFPIELSEDEKRMQSELMEALDRSVAPLAYSRTAGSGLRVPHHTDIRGEPLSGSNSGDGGISVSPDQNPDVGYEFLNDIDNDNSGPASLNFKEEDEYDMDLTH